jgi:hypothetical protein
LCAMICPDAAIIVFREVKPKSLEARSQASDEPLSEAA